MDHEDAQNARGNGGSSDSTRVQDILATLFSLQSTDRTSRTNTGHPTVRMSGITLHELARLLHTRTTQNAFALIDEHELDEEEEQELYDDDEYSENGGTSSYFTPVTEPQKEGLDLLASGDFGRVAVKSRYRRKDVNIAKTILNRKLQSIPISNREDTLSNLVPNTNGTTVATYDANMYTAQFSADSSFFYTCAQDFKMHIFDMKAPPTREPAPLTRSRQLSDYGLVTRMPVKNVINGHPGRWTITDANLSPDSERMIYSSIMSTVYMTNTSPEASTTQIAIPFADPIVRGGRTFSEGFGIWSCRFSADGNEVVAGGSGKIFVYDLLANKRTVKISAHNDDVNSCCWADSASGNVLVSASDDTYLKVWDRRSLGASRKPSGVLVGHTEGIAYVSAKGDGRYVISNGKDQTLRLWDLRKMRSSAEFDEISRSRESYGIPRFDYRYVAYPRPRFHAHPKDCSVMAYRGHSVLRTLIRCHFSPSETTGAQYIYSGSSDGRVHIWSLDGRIVQVLDCSKTLPASFSPSGPEPEPSIRSRQKSCVRDVSWHSQEPVILSAAWESSRGGTVISRHEYKGLLKMAGALEDWVEKSHLESSNNNGLRRSSRLGQHIPGSFQESSEEEEEI